MSEEYPWLTPFNMEDLRIKEWHLIRQDAERRERESREAV